MARLPRPGTGRKGQFRRYGDRRPGDRRPVRDGRRRFWLPSEPRCPELRISRLWLQCPLQQRHWPTRRTRLLQGVRWWSPGRPSRPQPRWNFPDWTRGLFVQLWRQVSEQDALLGAIHRAVLSLEVGAPAYLGGRSLQSRPLPGRDPAAHDDYDVEPGGHFPSWKPYGWMCGKLRDKSSFPLKPSKRTESRCLRDRLLILCPTLTRKLQVFICIFLSIDYMCRANLRRPGQL